MMIMMIMLMRKRRSRRSNARVEEKTIQCRCVGAGDVEWGIGEKSHFLFLRLPLFSYVATTPEQNRNVIAFSLQLSAAGDTVVVVDDDVVIMIVIVVVLSSFL